MFTIRRPLAFSFMLSVACGSAGCAPEEGATDAVHEIAKATKRDVRYVEIPLEEFEEAMAAQGVPTDAVQLMLAAGWPVDTKGEYEMTPLQWAAWHGNAEMVREILRYHPRLELKDNDHGITALGSALHGSMNGWHRDSGDYVATVEALLRAGAKAPEVTDDLEASDSVRDLLLQYAGGL